MSRLYQLHDYVIVKACQEVEEIVKKLNYFKKASKIPGDTNLAITYEERFYGKAEVTFNGHCFVDADQLRNLDQHILELSPFVPKPQLLKWQLDNQHGAIYLGPPEYRTETMCENALQHIRDDLSVLDRKEKKVFLQQLSAGIKSIHNSLRMMST